MKSVRRIATLALLVAVVYVFQTSAQQTQRTARPSDQDEQPTGGTMRPVIRGTHAAVSSMKPEATRADLQESIDIAKGEITRLDYIINQFLRAIRPAELHLNPENINALLQESISFLAPEIKDRDILVEQELRPDLPRLQVDRHQLKQAFYNVIKNSFQAMKSEGLLHIKTGMDDEYVSISFTDTGGGISPENMGKIFEPYFTTKASGSVCSVG